MGNLFKQKYILFLFFLSFFKAYGNLKYFKSHFERVTQEQEEYINIIDKLTYAPEELENSIKRVKLFMNGMPGQQPLIKLNQEESFLVFLLTEEAMLAFQNILNFSLKENLRHVILVQKEILELVSFLLWPEESTQLDFKKNIDIALSSMLFHQDMLLKSFIKRNVYQVTRSIEEKKDFLSGLDFYLYLFKLTMPDEVKSVLLKEEEIRLFFAFTILQFYEQILDSQKSMQDAHSEFIKYYSIKNQKGRHVQEVMCFFSSNQKEIFSKTLAYLTKEMNPSLAKNYKKDLRVAGIFEDGKDIKEAFCFWKEALINTHLRLLEKSDREYLKLHQSLIKTFNLLLPDEKKLSIAQQDIKWGSLIDHFLKRELQFNLYKEELLRLKLMVVASEHWKEAICDTFLKCQNAIHFHANHIQTLAGDYKSRFMSIVLQSLCVSYIRSLMIANTHKGLVQCKKLRLQFVHDQQILKGRDCLIRMYQSE